MRLGPRLVLCGSVVGCVFISLWTFFVTSGVSLPIQITRSTSLDSQSTTPDFYEINCNISPKYPVSILRWCDLITKYSTKNSLPSSLIAALIWQESGGKTKAYSKSGAVGLMQIMPRDGLAASFMCRNGPCFSNRPTIAQLQDAEFNVKFGTRMLAGLVNKYGNLRDALKAYGPMDVGYYYADKVLGIYHINGN